MINKFLIVNNFVDCCNITLQSYDMAKMRGSGLFGWVGEGSGLFGFCYLIRLINLSGSLRVSQTSLIYTQLFSV